MPEVTMSIDVSVWCDTCGAGLCGDTREKNNSFHVAACPGCMKAKDEEITALEDKITELESELNEA